MAGELIRALRPKRVLDVGCALGFLVESFWDRGVEAWGIDVSPYAIANVRRDMQPYCRAASAADGIEGSYDLVTCIEVLEHMPEEQARSAAGHMTRASDIILFSSTPYDLSEPTHFNVRPVIWWLKLFQELGFSPDLGFDATFVCSHAMLLRRRPEPLPDDVLNLFALCVRQRGELTERENRINATLHLPGEIQRLAADKAALEAKLPRETAAVEERLTREKADLEEKLTREKSQIEEKLKAAEDEIARASALQDEVQRELEAAGRELEQLLGPGHASQSEGGRAAGILDDIATAMRSHAASLQSLDQRMGAVEHRTAQVANNVTGILESKIWRTLMRGGGWLQKILGL